MKKMLCILSLFVATVCRFAQEVVVKESIVSEGNNISIKHL